MAKGRILPKAFRLGLTQNWNLTAKSSNFPKTTVVSVQLQKFLRNKVKRLYKKSRWWDIYNRFLKILEKTKSHKKALKARRRQFYRVNSFSNKMQVRRRSIFLPFLVSYFSTSPRKIWSVNYRRPYGFWRWRQLQRAAKEAYWWKIFIQHENFLLSKKSLYRVKLNILNTYDSIFGSPSLWGIQLNSSGMSKKYFRGYLTAVTVINLALSWRNPELIAVLIARELARTRNHYRVLKLFGRMLPNFLKSKWQITGIHIRYRGAFINSTRSKDVIHTTRIKSQKIYFQTITNPTEFFMQPALTFRGVIAVSVWLF